MHICKHAKVHAKKKRRGRYSNHKLDGEVRNYVNNHERKKREEKIG